MFRSLSALLLSATLAATGVLPSAAAADYPPKSARSSDGEQAIGALLFGLTALAVVGAIARNNRDDGDDDDRRTQINVPPPQPERQHAPRQAAPAARDHYVLPGHCLNRIHTRQGDVRLFTQRCLRIAGVNLNRLPHACYRQVHANSGHMRHGFVPRCMGHHGYVNSARRH